MIIWSGFGFLVVVIVIASTFLAQIITRAITGNDQFFDQSSIPFDIAMFFSSAVIYFLGKWLNTRKAKTYIDKETGKEIILKRNHSLFFIKMEYWGIIIIVIMVILSIKELLK